MFDSFLCLELPDLEFCVFQKRINRFLVEAIWKTRIIRLSLGNTGRLTDLLLRGRRACFLPRKAPKTEGRLIGIEVKKNAFALLDTNLMELAFSSALARNLVRWLKDPKVLKRNPQWKGNKFDFLLESEGEEWMCELKGALLQKGNAALYPDCPSPRGKRHIRELINYAQQKNRALLCFVTSLPGVSCFQPNYSVDPTLKTLFIQALKSGMLIKSVAFRFFPPQILLENQDLPVKL
ncbi:DNA/RNA nuclease SfsA [Thermatribacter velox]|uniref:DNA/RNA nuclease SfsA n=1 Tax=Thermatribacter velox TaxID=3039681 RepID=A0ABZ2YDH9_9BACT